MTENWYVTSFLLLYTIRIGIPLQLLYLRGAGGGIIMFDVPFLPLSLSLVFMSFILLILTIHGNTRRLFLRSNKKALYHRLLRNSFNVRQLLQFCLTGFNVHIAQGVQCHLLLRQNCLLARSIYPSLHFMCYRFDVCSIICVAAGVIAAQVYESQVISRAEFQLTKFWFNTWVKEVV